MDKLDNLVTSNGLGFNVLLLCLILLETTKLKGLYNKMLPREEDFVKEGWGGACALGVFCGPVTMSNMVSKVCYETSGELSSDHGGEFMNGDIL